MAEAKQSDPLGAQDEPLSRSDASKTNLSSQSARFESSLQDANRDGEEVRANGQSPEGKLDDIELRQSTSSKPLPMSPAVQAAADVDATPVAGAAFPHAWTPVAGPSVTPKQDKRQKALSLSALRNKVCRAAANGDLDTLISLLHPDDDEEDPDYPSSFALVNSPTSSGLTPLLEAAQHGHLHVVKHLIEEEGAVRDLEDVEGENAFLKASYRGHLSVMQYLAENEEGTDINASDREGWSAMHNAAGKGYLGIVQWLAEKSAHIDAQSRQGYTPLMNAASKGQLPIVNYLVSRHRPDPFIRNTYDETAYDVAVATFELGIAEILSELESRLWAERFGEFRGPYNPLAIHLTVPIILHENQRLDLRWQTRATRKVATAIATGQRHSEQAHFSSSALSRRDGHASSELPPSYAGINASGKHLPFRRSDTRLPSTEEPCLLPLPFDVHSSPSTPIARTFSEPRTPRSLSQIGEKAWYWLSDAFFVDLSPAYIDPDEGWQYATSFDAPDDQWSAEMSIELQRILAGEMPSSSSHSKWVRRRRWARIMRRRLDIPSFGFADVTQNPEGEREPRDRTLSTFTNSSELADLQDYLERAKYFAGSHTGKHRNRKSFDAENEKEATDTESVVSYHTLIGEAAEGEELDRATGRRIIGRLERALEELKEGLEDDTHEGRRTEAHELQQVFETRLRQLQQEFPGISSSQDDDDESFHYPGGDGSDADDSASISTSLRSVSAYSPRASPPRIMSPGLGSPPLGRQTVQRPDFASISQQLSSNPDFRVPTNEAPRRVVSQPLTRSISGTRTERPRSTVPWEPDERAHDCRRCHRKFTFFIRKHHCRKCGLVVCAQCSRHEDYLDYSSVVQEPGLAEPWASLAMLEGGGFFRTCDTCHESIMAHSSAGASTSLLGAASDPDPTMSILAGLSLSASAANPSGSPVERSISDASELGECPVCGTDLHLLGDKPDQEAHVQACLTSGVTARLSASRYLVFSLPETSPLLGTDCLICFESYEVGNAIGRLSCLCHFHKHCISNWLSRGKSCPVHAR